MTGPSTLPDELRPIAHEADIIQDAAGVGALCNFVSERRWRHAHVLLGAAVALLAAVSAVVSLLDVAALWSGIAALAAAGIATVTTAMNPSRRRQETRARADAWEQLQNDARLFLRIDLPGATYDEARAGLAALTHMYTRLINPQAREGS